MRLQVQLPSCWGKLHMSGIVDTNLSDSSIGTPIFFTNVKGKRVGLETK